MLLKHFFIEKIAHSSYLLADASSCAIIDPQRDISIYLETAKSMGLKITHILETHLHADFISGHMDLAETTGAKIYAPRSARCSFPHVPLSEGSRIRIGDLSIRILETPGHTPEHISYVVSDLSRGPEPACIFCGDTLFVGDVGRPDLFPDKATRLASALHESLHRKILALPDFTEVYPAHGAGSLCGRSIGARWWSTIGYERRYNASLQLKKENFVYALTNNMPPAPDHFSRCSAINGKGPALIEKLPVIERMAPKTFLKAIQKPKSVVLDVRSYDSFGGQHIPNSLNIDLGGNFPTFAGWILPPDWSVYLVTESNSSPEQAAVWLRRVGIDRILGVLDGGMFAWAKEGLRTAHIPQLSCAELADRIQKNKIKIVDVRTADEYKTAAIHGSIHIPAPELRTRHSELDRNEPVVLICSTGHRSSMAASLLLQKGFQHLTNVAGGMTGMIAGGYSVS